MKKLLRILALVVALATAATWLALGANRGWTKTEIAVPAVDEVTGLDYIKYKKSFYPGLDFLGAGLIGAGFLTVVSIFVRSKSKSPN